MDKQYLSYLLATILLLVTIRTNNEDTCFEFEKQLESEEEEEVQEESYWEQEQLSLKENNEFITFKKLKLYGFDDLMDGEEFKDTKDALMKVRPPKSLKKIEIVLEEDIMELLLDEHSCYIKAERFARSAYYDETGNDLNEIVQIIIEVKGLGEKIGFVFNPSENEEEEENTKLEIKITISCSWYGSKLEVLSIQSLQKKSEEQKENER